MFAPTRTGSICGWTPSNDSYDPHYTTIATASSSTSTLYDPSPPLASTPRAARNPIPRSLSLDSAVRPRSISDATDTSSTDTLYTPYHNPTSTRRYKAKREVDPSWAPRPPNAFILFRREYVEKHKGGSVAKDSKEQTLSKRAGDAWKALAPDSKRPWFAKAKIEALKHAAANPGYVYRPKKTRSEPRKHPALLSRREQVEDLVRKTSRRRALASRDRRSPARFGCPTPGSAGSSPSPEPPGTPSSEESSSFSPNVPTGLLSRSDSLPARFEYPPAPAPVAPNRAYLTPPAMLSMPSLVSHRPIAPKRSFSHSDMQPHSLWDYVNLGDEYSESDEQSVYSFESAVSEPSPPTYLGGPSEHPSPVGPEITLQTPEGQYIPEPQLGTGPMLMPEPQVMPTVDPSTTMLPESSVAYPPPPPSPLFERRRRAATISALPSPLTVITSSLSGWARDDLVTARMAPRAEPSPPSQPIYQLMTDNDNWTRNIPPNFHEMPLAAAMPIPDPDMDTTPRVPVFPQNVQSNDVDPLQVSATVEFPVPELQPQGGLPVQMLDPFDLSADLECYSLGLRQFGIGCGGPEAPNYGAPPFDVDYSSLFACDNGREQA